MECYTLINFQKDGITLVLLLFCSLFWQMEDILWDSLTDSYTGFPMAITAENLADQYKISKEECDKYALQTQQRWKAGKSCEVILTS